jgi:hypothetical protein
MRRLTCDTHARTLLAGTALVALSSPQRGSAAAADVAAAALAALTVTLAPTAADWRRLAYSFGILLAPTLAVGGAYKHTLAEVLSVIALMHWVHWVAYATDGGAMWSVIGALIRRAAALHTLTLLCRRRASAAAAAGAGAGHRRRLLLVRGSTRACACVGLL